MNAMFSEARAKVSHRLAMHLHANSFQMRNTTPMVSFTFDDLPKSAATSGADLLETHGARGTFYVSGGLIGGDTRQWPTGDADDVLSLYRRGHEIGCHTFSHRRASDLNVAALANEIMRNRDYLRALDASIETQTFAYPYGLRIGWTEEPAQGPVPDLPQHRTWHQQRHSRFTASSRRAADRRPNGPRRDRTHVRRGTNQ